jgi:CheY-like chemotaxis protein
MTNKDAPLVLVADDEEDIRTLVAFRLDRAEYEVMVTADPVSQAQVLGPRGGVLRQQRLPKLYASEVRLHAGDMLVLATDGVAHQSLGSVDRLASVQAAADRMLAAACQGNDDALVLVARYRGDAT